MTTVTEITTAPASGYRHIDGVLDNGPGWNWLAPARNTLYYSFTLPPGTDSVVTKYLSGSASTFNAVQRGAALEVIANLSQITGISFVETADDALADLHFAAGDITDRSFAGYCAWRWSYSSSGGNVTGYSADAYVFLDNVEYNSKTATPTVANGGVELMFHELGHALGLKHPVDGAVQLPAAEDNTSYTRMSYKHVGGPYSSYGPDDIAALMWLYGGDGLGGALGQGGRGVYLVGTAGADRLHGGSGADRIDGGDGLDTAQFDGPLAGYRVIGTNGTNVGNSVITVQAIATGITDTLLQVERLAFLDHSLAFDLAGSAGTTAKFLAAVFGTAAVHNERYAGIGLSLLDGGMSDAALMQLALEERLGKGFKVVDEVAVLYQNLSGQAASAADLQYWTGQVAAGQFTPVSLALMAAEHALNLQHVDLVGLAQTGLGYS